MPLIATHSLHKTVLDGQSFQRFTIRKSPNSGPAEPSCTTLLCGQHLPCQLSEIQFCPACPRKEGPPVSLEGRSQWASCPAVGPVTFLWKADPQVPVHASIVSQKVSTLNWSRKSMWKSAQKSAKFECLFEHDESTWKSAQFQHWARSNRNSNHKCSSSDSLKVVEICSISSNATASQTA